MRYLLKTLVKRFKLFIDRIFPENNLILDEDWYKSEIGGKWDQIGKLQFEFLKNNGLKPSSYLLDIGCGSLRGGRLFIEYLEAGHYYGIDKEKHLLQAGREKVIEENDLHDKNPELLCIENFNFQAIDREFDFCLAQSVFTHLPPEKVLLCLEKTYPLLKQGGKFYATYLVSDHKVQIGSEHTHRKEEYNKCFYPVNWFLENARDIGYDPKNVGDWGHPRDQQMMLFEKNG